MLAGIKRPLPHDSLPIDDHAVKRIRCIDSQPATLDSVPPPAGTQCTSVSSTIHLAERAFESAAPGSRSSVSREALRSAEEARLTARYQDDFRRIWSGSVDILRSSTGLYDLIVRLGLWTGTMIECGTLSRAHHV